MNEVVYLFLIILIVGTVTFAVLVKEKKIKLPGDNDVEEDVSQTLPENETNDPNEPDEPDEPDEPNEPEENCESGWSQWSECIADNNCGEGIRTRNYVITKQAPDCPDPTPEPETTSCTLEACPIDCESEWRKVNNGECNVECGGGIKKEIYVINQEPNENGVQCDHEDGYEKIETCNEFECPECVEDWGEWGDCLESDVTDRNVNTGEICGVGKETRIWETIPPSIGDKVCVGHDGSGVTTQTRSCNLPLCPVNCEGEWGEWSECSLDCGGGTRTRTFNVKVAAQNRGLECSNPAIGDVETESCNTHQCPVECQGSWKNWSDCDKDCKNSDDEYNGSRTKSFEVTAPMFYDTADPNPPPKDCLSESSDWGDVEKPSEWSEGMGIEDLKGMSGIFSSVDSDQKVYTFSRECDETPRCRIDCQGQWSDWTQCSLDCKNTDSDDEYGTQQRTYTTTVPAQFGGRQCLQTSGSTKGWRHSGWMWSNRDPEHCMYRVEGYSQPQVGNCQSFVDTLVNTDNCPKTIRDGYIQGKLTAITSPSEINLCSWREDINNYDTLLDSELENGITVERKCTLKSRCPIDCEEGWKDEWEPCQANNPTLKRTYPNSLPESDVSIIDGTPCGKGVQLRKWEITRESDYFGKECTRRNGEVGQGLRNIRECNLNSCPVDCEIGYKEASLGCKVHNDRCIGVKTEIFSEKSQSSSGGRCPEGSYTDCNNNSQCDDFTSADGTVKPQHCYKQTSTSSGDRIKWGPYGWRNYGSVRENVDDIDLYNIDDSNQCKGNDCTVTYGGRVGKCVVAWDEDQTTICTLANAPPGEVEIDPSDSQLFPYCESGELLTEENLITQEKVDRNVEYSVIGKVEKVPLSEIINNPVYDDLGLKLEEERVNRCRSISYNSRHDGYITRYDDSIQSCEEVPINSMCEPEKCNWGQCWGGEVYSECGMDDNGNCISMSKEDKGCAKYDNDDMGCEDGYNNYYDCSYNSSNDTCEARSPYNHKCFDITRENTCENEENGEYCEWDNWVCRNKSSGSGSSQQSEYSCKKESEIKEIGLRSSDLCEDDDDYVSLGNYRCSDIQDTEESRDYYCNFDSLEKRNNIYNYDKSGKRIDDACPLSCKVKGCTTDCSDIVSKDLCNSTSVNGVQCEYLEPGCEETCSQAIEREYDSPYYSIDLKSKTGDIKDKCPQVHVYTKDNGVYKWGNYFFDTNSGGIPLENDQSCKKENIPSTDNIETYGTTGSWSRVCPQKTYGRDRSGATRYPLEFYWDLCYEQRTEGVCRATEPDGGV